MDLQVPSIRANARARNSNRSFVGIDKAEITAASLAGKRASITVNFLSQLISATRNRAGEVIDGDPAQIREVNDVWTFERDTASNDPNWKLVATEDRS